MADETERGKRERVKEKAGIVFGKISTLSVISFINGGILITLGMQLFKLSIVVEPYKLKIESLEPGLVSYLDYAEPVSCLLVIYAFFQLAMAAYFWFERGVGWRS